MKRIYKTTSFNKTVIISDDKNKYYAHLEFTEGKSNKFYKISIHPKGKKYVVHTEWGRIGTKKPTSKDVIKASLDQAKILFRKKFHEKTGNFFGHGKQSQRLGFYGLVDEAPPSPIMSNYQRVEEDTRKSIRYPRLMGIREQFQDLRMME